MRISARSTVVDGVLSPVTVRVDDGLITAVEPYADPQADVVLDDGVLSAGLVDIQINGSFGVDFAAAEDADWDAVAAKLPSTGVTSFQPTLITAPLQQLIAGLDTATEARDRQEDGPYARILGVHLEGPWLAPLKKGVHEAKYLAEPTPEAVEALMSAVGFDILTTLTLAPELPGALEAIKRLSSAGVTVSIGHTNATAAQVDAAADAGATLVTHIFNAQRGLAHREPGVPGAALADSRYRVGLIADLHHVAAEICTLIFRAAPGRVVLVTDAIAAAGMPPGSYVLAGIPVELGEDGVPRNADGTIAGSALTLDQAVRNMIGLGMPLTTVIEAASKVPADAVGRPDIGRIAVDARADLVHWTEDFHPARTWVDGREIPAFADTGVGRV